MIDAKLCLIDANSLFYRAFFAIKSQLTTSAGQPTNAVFGFVKMVNKILGELDIVADKIKDSGIIVNEDNIIEEATKYTDRKIESMEKFLLLGKIGKYEN